MDATRKDIRKFAITLAIVLSLIGGLNLWRGHVAVFRWLVGIGASFLILGLSVPILLRPFFFVFIKVTHAIGWFNSRLLLAIIYYILITPMGLFMKLFRKDPLHNKEIDRNLGTYWVKKKEGVDDVRRYEKQF